MPFLPDTRHRRDRRGDFGKADEACQKKRTEGGGASASCYQSQGPFHLAHPDGKSVHPAR
jgi:hypothetical protein